MSITLSHTSALSVLRMLRTEGVSVGEMDTTAIARPSTWVGKRWTMREFDPAIWHWPRPTQSSHLHVLVPKGARYIRMSTVDTHSLWRNPVPADALWVDEHTSIVCPELLFLQMAEALPLPSLVMLGYELCGNFSRNFENPLEGDATIGIPVATSVERLTRYLSHSTKVRGVNNARKALKYMSDHALSPMEALLATVYSLPLEESGYGMGPLTLNDRVPVGRADESTFTHARYPDLSFSFAPIGLNYDGGDHLDLEGLVRVARMAESAENEKRAEAEMLLREKMDAVRAKVVDDTTRNRQLAASGRIVFPITKENVYGWGNLDEFTWQIVSCAQSLWDINVACFEQALEDSDKKHDRYALLMSFLPSWTADKAYLG